ncbi:MAG TPA: hypothetical protein VFA15_05440, partial [Nitrososphaera sp.]|nr:hypothetical protein [Nitrososphaera sp.]
MNLKIAVLFGMAAILSSLIFIPQLSFAAETQVSIVPGAQNLGDKAFSPNPVNIAVGDKVTWTNTDTAVHTATSGDGNTGTKDNV